MIYYFSGTGNSKWAAERLAELLGDQAKDIMKERVPQAQREQVIGLVFPIYAWGVCEPMLSFVKQMIKTEAFVFALGTCGEDCGKAMNQLLKAYPADSCYSIAMPSNYVIAEELESRDVIEQKMTAARSQLQTIAEEVMHREKTYRVHEGKHAAMKTVLINPLFKRFARTVKPFCADERCNGCGWCAAACPASVIQMEQDRPRWSEGCFQCLRCLNGCPQKAIQYGKKSKNTGRYRIEEYLPK